MPQKKPQPKKFDPINVAVVAIGVVAIVAVAIWAAMRSDAPSMAGMQPTGAMPQMQMPAADPHDHDHEAELAVPRMTVAEFAEKAARNEAVAIDVRDINTYLAGHIPGSLHIPTEYIQGELPWLPRDKTIVTYCT
jgi:hypothetical protein